MANFRLSEVDPNGDVGKPIHSHDGVDLEVDEEVDQEAENILLHVAVNVEKVCDTEVINRFWEEILAQLLDEGVVAD